MSLVSSQLLGIARKVLSEVGIHDYTDLQLTYALKESNEWRVSVTFTSRGAIVKRVIAFTVNAETEEIIGIWLDRKW